MSLVPAALDGLLLLVIAATVGLATFRWAVLERLKGEVAFPMLAFPALRRAWALGWAVTLVAILLPPMRMAVESVQRFGPDALFQGRAMLATRWGIGLMAEVAAANLLGIGLMIAGAQGRRAGWTLIGVAAALATLVPGLSLPALGASGPTAIETLSATVYVAAVSACVGGLGVILLVGLPALREADVPRQLEGTSDLEAALAACYRGVAVIGIALAAASGAAAARIRLGSWSALTESGYGRTLLIELALVGAVTIVGASLTSRHREVG